MTSDLRIQGEVVVNSEQAESAFNRVGDKAQQMATEVATSAGKAGQSVDKIGDGAGASAEKFTRAESRISASIKRATNELELLGKTASQRLEFNIADKGLDPKKFEPALQKLREVEAQAQAAQRAASGSLDKMGISAAQTAAALRGVPAQFTDIVTSLQGGQAPLTVFLQQGGQLRDMFGGAGAAARALGGYVLGLINPFTIAAAAVGAIALAYNQGSEEADGYRMALVMTGNAAGTTASQMQQMAGRISSVVGTQGAAADALAQMASSGRVASQSLEYFSEVAIKFERTTGTAISETVKRFAELGASPVDASRKLNEETNYLTASIYEQIKALKDQGREADAAALAQNTYADALNNRSAQITQNLGAIEGAWKAIKDAAKSGWDAMLNVGRADSLGTQIDNIRAKIAQAKGLDKNRPFSMPWDTSLADLEKQLSYLTEQERMIRRGAEAQAQRTQAEKDAIAAADALQKTQASGMTNQQKMNKALEEYARHIEKLKATNPTSVLLSPDAIARGEKAIRDQFSDKGKGSAGIKAVNKDLADQQRIYAELAGVSSTYHKELAAAQEQRAKGNVSEAQYVAYVNDLIQKQPFAVALAKEEAKEQQTLDKANLDAAQSREKYLTSLSTGLDKIQADIAAQEEATARMGLSKEAIAELDAAKLEMLATDLELQAIKAMDRNLDQQTYDALKKQAAAYRELGIAKKGGAAKEAALELENANAEAAKKAQEDWERTSDQINQSLTDALMRGFESGKDFAKNMRDTVVNMFKTMVLRPVVSAIVRPVAGAITGALGLSSAAQAGQGGAGSLLGTASNLNTAWGMLSGTGGNMGALTGLMSGSMSWANAMGSVYANTTGTGISGLLATNGAYGTAGGAGAGLGATAAGIAAIAAPLIIGSLIERNARDRFSGAAYATSGGNDPFVNTVAGSTSFDYLTGDLPDRAALMARLEELGAPMEAISDWNDRALLRLMESAAADNSEFGINWTSRVRDMRDTADFYRGAGYAHPEELGWWNNKDNANLSTDPALIQASRDIALSIIGPLEGIGALIGDEAAYRATVGFANRGEGNGLWAGMNLQRDGQNVADWVNTDDFHSVGEAVRAMYSTALGTLDSFDLPGWADKQVTDARTALDALSGDKIGEQAAALYQQATGGISATFAAIEKMVNLFPDFAEASQDAVYALGELTGGLDNLASAYGSYLSNFYSEEERRQLMFKELGSELDKLGIDTIPRTRAEFRELVSAQDLSTEAGREAFTVLMKLSGGFAEFVDAAESAADNARERIDSIFGQISKLWDEQISNWSKLSSEAKSVFDVAIKAAKDLRGQVADTRQWDARAASVWIDQALAGLRATGALPDSKELADAIAAARGGLDMSQYDTVAEMERDQLILAGKLNEIGDSAEVQMSFAEQQVQLLEQQRDYWRQQIDLLTATGETITSIDQGIEYLADYVREQAALKAAEEAEKEASREAARRAALSISPGGWGGGGWGGGGGQDLTSITRTINWDTGEYVYPDGSGGTLTAEELEYFRKILDGELDPTRIISDLYQVPRHADGGRYAGGLALVGERGPELINFASPGHVYTAVQTRDMMRGGDNAELIAELRELRARLDKIERNTAVLPQTHDVIDRVTAGGNAMLTEAA